MAKTYDYIVVLKRRSFKLVNTTTLIMLFLAIVMMLITAFTPFGDASILPISISALIVGWCAYVYARHANGKTAYFRIALLFAAWGLLLALPNPYNWIAAALYVLAAVMEKQVKFPREIAFATDEVVINSFPRKRYNWKDISNVVLKDGMLTLDMKNNRLIQKEIDTATSPELENEFNSFCRSLLEQSNIHPTHNTGSTVEP